MSLANRLAAAGIKLPVKVSTEPGETGVLVDAAGRDFATIDQNGERADSEADAIAIAVADAINLAAVPTSFEAQLAKVRNGATLVRVAPLPKGEFDRTLGGVSTGML